MSSNPLQKKGEGREIFFLEDWKKGSEVSEIFEGISSSWRFAVIIWKISVRPEEEVKRSEETGREDFSTDSSLLPHHRFFINFPLKKFDSSEERGGGGQNGRSRFDCRGEWAGGAEEVGEDTKLL